MSLRERAATYSIASAWAPREHAAARSPLHKVAVAPFSHYDSAGAPFIYHCSADAPLIHYDGAVASPIYYDSAVALMITVVFIIAVALMIAVAFMIAIASTRARSDLRACTGIFIAQLYANSGDTSSPRDWELLEVSSQEA
ncbi:hypothetical protein RhiJN_06824 [Ceratobasidium sp. AG-Ba]|nr:hypothetical protein RhiJN_06824 [Ceratobasidium sp. AG-Ba]QRW07739.1 hypothetical protein RhiLY_06738 [Ceratobasidium sp. AG-Ba]